MMNKKYKPMTVAEVEEMLKVTQHGPMPQEVVHRIFATLASWKDTINQVIWAEGGDKPPEVVELRDQLALCRDDMREAERRHTEEMRGYARELLEMRGLYAVACKRLQDLGEEFVPLTEAPGPKPVPDVVYRCRVCEEGFTMEAVNIPVPGPLGSVVVLFWCRKCGRLLIANPDFIEVGCSEEASKEYFGRIKQFFEEMVAAEREKWEQRKNK
jgi:hypothetical protein